MSQSVKTITTLETLVLCAIFSNECRDGESVDQPVWVDMVAEDAGLNVNQLGGVIASLTKKGLVCSDGETVCATQEAFNLTPLAS